jgi:hypothetical protein
MEPTLQPHTSSPDVTIPTTGASEPVATATTDSSEPTLTAHPPSVVDTTLPPTPNEFRTNAAPTHDNVLPAPAPPQSDITHNDFVYEGVENLTANEGRHEKRFYELLFPKVKNLMDKSKGGKMMFRIKYNKILYVCQSLKAGVPAAVLKKQQGYTKVYAWSKTFDVFEFGSSSCVVLKAEGKAADELQRVSYYERLFSDLLKIHKECGHGKGRSLYRVAEARYYNLTEEHCKLFTDTCPICHPRTTVKKPTAGVKNIITPGFGVRGQVDLIDFQSMPDGKFVYLLNYIDHGINSFPAIKFWHKIHAFIFLIITW